MIDKTTALLTIAAAKKEAGKAVDAAMPVIADMVRQEVDKREVKTLADVAITLKGDKGDTGPQGLPGKDGQDGKPGKDGKDGKPGQKGDRGEQGPQGIPGQRGANGKDGKDGRDGKDGQDGRDGKDGQDGVGVKSAKVNQDGSLIFDLTDGRKVNAGKVKGKDTTVIVGGGGGSSSGGSSGADGASAYEVAVANGFVGTEAEWLASLVGPAGADGTDGANGANGVDGVDGADGIDGTNGSDGAFSLLMKPAAGVYVSQGAVGGALGTVAQVADRNTVAPFIPSFTFTIDQVAISVSTAVAGTNSKVLIYASDANGRPDAVLIEGSNISCAVAGTITSALSFTFQKGVKYWIGVRSSSTQTLRSLPAASLPVLSYTNAATPIIQTVLVKTETYANPASAWGYSSSQHSSTTMPVVLLRVA